MRKLILSTKNSDSENHVDSLLNRAFLHADGFFTTMFLHEGKIADLLFHYNRIINSCAITGNQIPEAFKSFTSFKVYLHLNLKSISAYSRVKIICWRKDGKGFQVPENSTVEYALIIESESYESRNHPIYLVDVSIPRIPNRVMPSSIKWLHGMNSIFAQQEAQKKKGTLALQTTIDGMISETALACVVWFDGDKFFTPSNECDLVEGTCLQSFKEFCHSKKIRLEEIKQERTKLKSVEWFVLNAKWGMKSIQTYNGIAQKNSEIAIQVCTEFNAWRWEKADLFV